MSETLDRPEVADEVVDAKPASSAITEYNVTAQALAELRQRLAGKVYSLQTVAGDKEARADRLELVKLRSSLESKRKELKAPALERSRLIDAEAKRIEGEILALEGPIDKQIKADEARREEERAARAAAEQARVEALRKRIEYLRGIAPRAAGKPASEVAAKIAMVEGITIGPDFAEFQTEAQDVHAQVLEQLRDMHAATVAQEEAAARVKAESERLARVDHYGRKLMELRSLSVGMGSRSAAAIRVALDTLRTLAIDAEGWAEFAPQAEEARTAVLAELSQMLEAAETREAIAAQQAHEAQRLAAQKAEQDRVAAEQRAAELQRQQEADARAESARLEALAVERRAQQAATTYPSGAPMFSTTHVKENGDLMMLDEQGKRSVFCDVDEGDTEVPATAPAMIGIDPGAPEGDRTVYAEIPADDGRRYSLGAICEEVGHGFKMTEAFVKDTLGIASVGRERASVQYTSQMRRGIFAALRAQLDLLVAKS